MKTSHSQAFKDYEWLIKSTRIGMKSCGIWPDKQRPRWQKILINIQVMILTSWVLYFVTMPSLRALIKVWGNMTLIIDNFTMVLPFTTAIFKLVVIWYKEEDLTNLFIELREDWIKSKTVKEREIMIKNGKISRTVTVFSYILVLWLVVAHYTPFWIAGIIPRTRNNITDGERALPMQTIYFHNVITNGKNFQLTGIAQAISSLLVGSCYTTVDCVFGTLILHISGQLEILKLRIENMCNNYDNIIPDDPVYFTKILRDNMRIHQKLIRFVETTERVFSMMLLIQFTAFAIIFASEGFHVISSYAVHSAAYNSQWFNLKPKDMSQLVIIIARAQKPLIITAGKFAPISLNTFASLTKTSAGYISMLLAVKS
ncbi:hypothetical protein PV327_002811 [Microctonus hyperodae]|uniref:Odorant receptor n=1 Tax=Microctonus hyperodae TaxID=165561 RepID=A0AA39FGB6_MICHY|nr:hypothetical protein PV327_002811 [Microctonus hyperodae]